MSAGRPFGFVPGKYTVISAWRLREITPFTPSAIDWSTVLIFVFGQFSLTHVSSAIDVEHPVSRQTQTSGALGWARTGIRTYFHFFRLPCSSVGAFAA